MIAHTLDRYQKRESPIHHLDPRVKVLAAVFFILGNSFLPDSAWMAFSLSWLLILIVTVLARLSPTFVLKRSLIALPFALAAVTVLFTLPGDSVLVLGLGRWQLVVTDAGWWRFAAILVRSWLSVQMAILLTAVTAFPDLMHALGHLRLPQPLIAIISFMYRYLFLLAEEATRLLRARQARSARPTPGSGGGSVTWRARVAGHMVGQLFLRSYERSQRVYQAMLARGYRGQFMTVHPHAMRKKDWGALALALVILVLIQVVGRLPAIS